MAQQYDFTNQLPATLPTIGRPDLVKFNNSWLYWGHNNRDYDFVVVYRAMAYHPFAVPSPTLPGHPGTPWAAGWANPGGPNPAELEGQIPTNRTGRYFDGIGVSGFRLTLNLGDDNINQGQRQFDTILSNSDGFEDPRIFRVGNKIYIHSHRYHPDPHRGALDPEHQVYQGYTPERAPVNLAANNPGLFIKINELIFNGNQARLGPSYFYGTNVSDRREKNYGFFEDNGTLNAVYGVAPNGRPFTLLRSVGAAAGQEMLRFPRSNVIVCEEFQPNTGHNTDCFLELHNYYNSLVPRTEIVIFSSSGPLLQFANLWHGVGHVKIFHPRVMAYMLQLAQFVHDVGNNQPINANFGSVDAAANAYLNDTNNIQNSILQHIQQNPNSLTPYIVNFVNAIQPNNPIQANNVTNGDKERFFRALQANFFNMNLVRFVTTAYQLPQGHVEHWSNNPTPNPRVADNRIIFHPSCFYLTFLYSLQLNTYRLDHFSNAFLVFDANSPKMLQFASNLAPLASGLLIGFGEDDNRAKVLHLTGPDFQGLYTHDATNFNPRNYQFQPLNSNEIVW